MIFKHPELLYGLCFLLLPIIVHLFQLRRFKKVAFTNVAALRPLALKSRKSRQLKKWLTLFTRLCIVAVIIIAFAQPFIPSIKDQYQSREQLFYLDNSFSMELSNERGSLYEQVIQDLMNYLEPDGSYRFFTNSDSYIDYSKEELIRALQRDGLTHNSLTIQEVLLKATALKENRESITNLVYVSDFKEASTTFDSIDSLNFKISKVPLRADKVNNISIDSAWVTNLPNQQLKVLISADSPVEEPLNLKLEEKGRVIATTIVNLFNEPVTATLDIPLEKGVKGTLKISDNALSYDNSLFISLAPSPLVKTAVISSSTSKAFIDKIFTQDRFDLEHVDLPRLNYNQLDEYDLILLNELSDYPADLLKQVQKLTKDGVTLIHIPSKNINTTLQIGNISLEPVQNKEELKITSVEYKHPLFKNVFEREVSNFQYPIATPSVSIKTNAQTILGYQNGSPFLVASGNCYSFTAPLSAGTNFKDSPLIVPVLFNMGKTAAKSTSLYYYPLQQQPINVKTSLGKDDILSIVGPQTSLIPAQIQHATYVSITGLPDIKQAGIYSLMNKESEVAQIAINHSRHESNTLRTIESETAIFENSFDSLAEVIIKSNQDEEETLLWRWFLCAALFFLLIEILLLKYLK